MSGSHVEMAVVRKALEAALDRIEGRATEPPDYLLDPHDGGPKLRPHGRDGKFGWQLWSGGICIALLSHEDVAPAVDDAFRTAFVIGKDSALEPDFALERWRSAGCPQAKRLRGLRASEASSPLTSEGKP